MQSPEASTAAPPTRPSLHLAVAGFADEIVGTLAHLLAYVGELELFAILSLAELDRLPDLSEDGAATAPESAFNQLDSLEKTPVAQRAAVACPPNRPPHAQLDRPSC